MGYIMGAYSDDNNPNATGKWTLTLRRAPGEPWLILSDMDNLNARPQQRKVPDTPSPTESPAAGHCCQAHTPSVGWVVWRGLTNRSIRPHFLARLNVGCNPSETHCMINAH